MFLHWLPFSAPFVRFTWHTVEEASRGAAYSRTPLLAHIVPSHQLCIDFSSDARANSVMTGRKIVVMCSTSGAGHSTRWSCRNLPTRGSFPLVSFLLKLIQAWRIAFDLSATTLYDPWLARILANTAEPQPDPAFDLADLPVELDGHDACALLP